MLCACGKTEDAVPISTPAPTPVPTAEPTPDPTPTPEVFLTQDGEAYLDGTLTPTYEGKFMVTEALEVLGSTDGTWHGIENDFEDKYVSVDQFCSKFKIGIFEDEEDGTIYCTSATGDWTWPEGKHVALMMYHGVSTGGGDEANLFMRPSELEEQILYILNNGYTPIWFEDLWDLENIEKPVILTFDDGWANLYTNLKPLIEKYGVKVTIFVNTKDIPRQEHGNHMSGPEMMEMYETGYVSIQSHCVQHEDLDKLTESEQEYQMKQSMLDIMRYFKKQPLAIAYPEGRYNNITLKLDEKYYKFAVIMDSSRGYWDSSDNPYLIERFFPNRGILTEEYAAWLEYTFE